MKTNKMKIMSFILTFIMLVNVLAVVPFTVSATDTGIEFETESEERDYLTLPEFEFPDETILNFSDLGFSTDEIVSNFPETIETKYENGIYYVEDIGAKSAYLLLRYDYFYNTEPTYENGWWMFEISEEQATDDIIVYFWGIDLWKISYTNGERANEIEIESEDGRYFLRFSFGSDAGRYDFHYSINTCLNVSNIYVGNELTEHTIIARIWGSKFELKYDADGNAEELCYTDYTLGEYFYLYEDGWSGNAPEGYEDFTLEDATELIPHDIEGNYPAPSITSAAIVVDGVEHQENLIFIYHESVVELKVYGENLNFAPYNFGFTDLGSEYEFDNGKNWNINESGTVATKTLDPSKYSEFSYPRTLRYYENTEPIDTDLSIYYLGCREHDMSGEQTCMGYFCPDCEEYVGEKNGNHDLESTQTCLGYWCNLCSQYIGEPSSEHTSLSEDPTCCGYYCYTCGNFAGEDRGDHVDTDNSINICDYCSEYLGTQSITLGENTVSGIVGQYVFMKFVPSESSIYKIYSTSENDPRVVIYDEELNSLGEYDDYDGSYNFVFERDFEGGETYYFAFYAYYYDFDFTVTVEKHIHSGTLVNCLGTYCTGCHEYFGEGNDDHFDGDDYKVNLCDYCYEYASDYNIELGETNVAVDEYENVYFRFVPEFSGAYKFFSTSESDPEIYLFDEDFADLDYSDDDNGYEFSLVAELEAGKTYYLNFADYEAPSVYTVTIEYHTHEFNILTCLGYSCECGKTDEDTLDEADPDAHIWDDGDCEICGEDHPCESEDFDEDGYCVICDNDAGFIVTTNGVSKYYDGLTAALEAAVDGSVLTLLEYRRTNKVYNIYKDIVFDVNGYGITTYDDGAINVYANVTFMDSQGYGWFNATINVYEKCNFLNGEYSEINLYNGLKYSDVIYACSYANMYDPVRDTFVNINSLQMDERDYVANFILYNDDPYHVFSGWWVSSDATCTENAIETISCVYCGFVEKTRVKEDSATGHNYKPAYGEGYTECTECDEVVENQIYSGDFGRDLGANVVNVAYDFFKNLIVDFVENNLSFLYE